MKLYLGVVFFIAVNLLTVNVKAAINVTASSNGQNICYDKGVGGANAGFTTINNIVIAEGSNTDFGGASTQTITISPPSGWQFNTSVLPTVSGSGTGITLSRTYSGGSLVITRTMTALSQISSNSITISGLQVQATSTSSANGNITNSSQSGTWSGLGTGTNLGTLSLRQIGVVTVSGGGGPFCGSRTLTASGGSGGSIYYQATTSNGTSTAILSSSQSVSSTGTYYFRASNTGCWGAQGSAAVTILPNPVLTSFSTSAPTACQGTGATVNITSTTLGAGTYNVTYNLTGANTIPGLTATLTMTGTTGSFTTGTLSNTGSTTVTITSVQNSSGCSATPGVGFSAAFSVVAPPGAVTVSGGGTFCGNATLTASGGSGGSIYYQGTTSNGVSTATLSSSQVISANGTYYFRARNASGCWGTQGSASLTINANPNVSAFGTSAATACQGAGTTVTVTSATLGTGTYTVTYNVTGTNTISGALATLTMTGTTGTFTTANLANAGANTVSITNVRNVNSCNAVPGSGFSSVFSVVAPPGAVTVTGGGATCTNATLMASGGSGGSIYYQGATSGGVSTATLSSSQIVSATGTYYFRARNASGCWGAEGSAAVTLNPLPTISAITAVSNVLCVGATVTLNAGTPTGTGALTSYNWTGPSVFSTTTSSPSTTRVTSTTGHSGAYSLTVTYPGTGCTSNPVSVTITVNALPTLGSISTAPSSLCAGATLTLNALTPSGVGSIVSYNWSGPNSYSTTTAAATASLATTAASSGEYSVSVTYPGTGCTSAKVMTDPDVTVNALPATTLAAAANVCLGAPLTLTATGTTGTGSIISYNWSGPNSFSTTTSAISTAFTASATATQSGTYSLTVTYSGVNCTSPVSTAAVSVNNLPVIGSITPSPADICVGYPLTLTAAGASGTSTVTSYNWTGPNSYSATTAGAVHTFTTTTTDESGIYSVSVTYNGVGCTSSQASASTAVTVNSAPTIAGITPSASSLCTGSLLTLTAGATTGIGSVTSYNWSGPNGFSTTTASNSVSLTAATTAASGAYSVTVSYSGSACSSAPSSVAVTVNSLPTLSSIVPSTTNMCLGAPLTLTANGAAGTGTITGYNWTGPNGFNEGTVTNSVAFTPTTTAASGNYSVSVVYDGAGCTSAAVVTSPAVTVNALPTVSGITPSVTGLCIGSPITFTAGAVSGPGSLTSYNWTGPNSFSTTTAANTTGLTATTTSQSGSYSVTVTYPGTGCTSSAAATSQVNVYNMPTVASITPSSTQLCTGTALTLTAGTTTGGSTVASYNWTGPNSYSTTTSANEAVFTPATAAASGNYSLTVTYSGLGCTSSLVQTSPAVTVNTLPSLTGINATPATRCIGQTLSLTANGATGTGSIISYNWSGPAGYSSTTAGNTQSYIVPATTASGSYSATVTYAGTGCTSSAVSSSPVTVHPLPSVFSVSGGGSYCSGGSGVSVGMAGSQVDINYQLYNGATLMGSPVAGDGNPISFGAQTMAGTYTVVGTNGITGCASSQSGSAFVNVTPTPNTYTVSGGGTYCEGTGGLHILLSSSDASVSYQLYLDGVAVGSLIVGDGNPIDFGAQTAGGTYTVKANPGSACETTMTGSGVIIMHPAPTTYNVSGGGTICEGAAGVNVNLSWSVLGINYQLYRGATAVGSPVAGATGLLVMGPVNIAGTYTVLATNASTGCTSAMAGNAVLVTNPAPIAYTVTGGGSACAGMGTVTVGLSGSDNNISYQLYNGSTAAGSPVAGNGVAISFGAQNVSGLYSVAATNTVTGCSGSMTGTVTVNITPAAVPYNVTGGGQYCAGGTGLTVGLAASNVGIMYQLYHGSSTLGSPIPGTGSSISFGTFTASGTYSVQGTNILTSCTAGMAGTATITINPLPDVYTVTGGGQYCSGTGGTPVGLSFSASNINYQLYRGTSAVGAPVAGNGGVLSFGNQVSSGVYTVQATNSTTSCSIDMSGSVTVTENPLPTQFAVTGGGDFCTGGTGVAVGLGGSQSGVNYQLYNGVPTVGSAVAGTGGAITFGMQGTAGTYTVLGTITATGCSRAMSGSATVSTNPLPSIYVVTGGGHYCENGTGVEVGLNNSSSGINYQLYVGGTATGSPVAGTDLPISFGLQTVMGTYTVLATNATTSCTSNMFSSASVVIDPLPTAHIVTGTGSYCAGGTGVAVGLATSTIGISYQIYNGFVPVGGPLLGTGSALNFGMQTAGTYTVLGTNNTTSCTNPMSGNATITANPLPTQFNVNGGGTYCQNGGGVLVGLVGSQSGVSYQLYNGSTAMGSPVAGGSGAISFGSQTLAGTYTVLATNTTTLCTKPMTSSATVIMNPAPTAYTVTGGGAYCSGGSGVSIGLNGSDIGTSYQLYRGATLVGGQVSGTGNALDFGMQTTAGTYTVHATNNSTTCTGAMSGSANVTINLLPTVYAVTGGGGYCIGGTGVAVGLANTQTGVNYQLYRGTTAVGTTMAGTGSSISFGLQTVAGIYTVQATNATTGCVRGMSNFASVVINALPTVYNVTGGGGYCVGSAGTHIGMSSSDAGVNYQLYLGASAIGSPLPGSGAGIDFGEVYVAGTYSVVATNSITGCVSPMTGSATVTINTPPAVYSITGGGSYCSGGAGVAVGVSNSQSGVNYTLYNGTSLTGTAVAGTGGAISFGSQLFAGTYTVRATNATSGCVTNMTGTATVVINSLPTVVSVTGGGSYCPGAGGVNVGLTGSTLGVTYQLYKGTTAVGAPITGTGAPLSMGVHTAVGTYTAAATITLTGCASNMTGSATISQNALPDEYTMTGGGNYCSGSTGVAVGLSGSQVGVSYKLYNSLALVGTFNGTGSALSFGLQTSTGSYSVNATITATGCTRNMAGTSTINVNALPTVYLTTGGGNYCAGGNGYTVVLNGSQTGIDYQLYRNGTPLGTMSGTGSFLDYGLQTVAGFYTVKATNSTTGCIRNMAGSPEIVVHALPTVFSVTGGGSYCAGGAGVAVGLSGSASGIGYRLYNGGTLVGATVSGNGSVLTFGAQPAAGVYTVQAVNSGTGCTSNMTGNATVVINAIPTAYSVTGGGGYCSGGAGVAIGLSSSASGVSYQLYKNGVANGSAMSGTGSALDFGMKTATGVYTIKATNGTTSCINNMTGSTTVSINPAPATYIVTGGGSYCAGGAGVEVGLNGSETGVNYTLYDGAAASGDAVAGTGAAISFGLHAAGTYTVMAANSTTTCAKAMVSSTNISVNALPLSYAVTGGGTMCAGTAGVAVSLSGSETNKSYTLYNGSTATGSVIVGTGSGISFGLQGTAGAYSVMATDMMTNCTNNMTGTASVSVNPAPAQYAVTGGGSYCAGGAGVTIGLAGSEAGLQYSLYKNGVATGVSATGTGAAVSFAPQFTNGNYTVMAVNNATSCTRAMTGSATVLVNTAPATYTVAGGGAYCAGGTGVNITLGGSATGVSYKLYKGTAQVGSTLIGTGGSLSFGTQQSAGVYTVQATSLANGCTTAMTGSATIVVNALPVAHAVTGGGSFCAGGTGVAVGLAASQTGVTYKLYKGTAQVSSMSGTGGALDFGMMTNTGTYTVAAVNNTTSCAAGMGGSATVQVNALPVAQTVIGGGSYCIGGTGVDVAIGSSQTGVNYQLYNGTAAVGDVVAGTGNVLSFGMQTATGTYSVAAVNSATSCTRGMTGTVSVSTNALPTVFTVTGGGSYCAGGTGVTLNLSGSQTGVTYRVYRNGTQVGVQAGTGAAMSLGNQTIAGVYTVMAENAAACSANMAGSATISVNTLPVAYTVSSGGAYCAGGEGVDVTLSGSETGVSYRLYNGTAAVGGIMEGTGSAISFGMMAAGSYSVKATNSVTSCVAAMTGTSAITINTLPTAFSMTGGGGYCDGGAGVAVGLSSSQLGMSYQLFNGTVAVGPAKTGTGGAVSFGAQQAGNYTAVATNVNTGCTKTMNGAATVFTHEQPMAFDVMGGGSYCAGGNGLAVTLGGSQSGINYRLYRGSLAVSTIMPSTGSNINFGAQTTAGDYTVKATNVTTGCSAVMTGTATISINELPQAYAMTGGGSYCAGGTGVAVGLESSASGMSYQLYMGTTAIGTALAGTGAELDFGTHTGAGIYKVIATNDATGCTANMSSTATIAINALPVAYTLSGSSTGYCQGGTGVQMMLNNSQTGVSYRLYNGAAVSGGVMTGTNGSSLSFGNRTAEGTYSVFATNNTTGCTSAMTGTPSIVINPLPAMFAINGGGSYCTGSEGVAVGLSGSQAGITYQLYKGGVATTSVEGNGSSVGFGAQLAGTYTVKAMNTATGCRSNMNGSAVVIANAIPTVYAVTGGGSYCAGGEGVNVGLANSASGIQYQLYNGTVATGALVNGGGAVSFGSQTEAGMYTVKAMNTATGCGADMTGSATVVVNATPEAETVTGGGALCVGSAGITVSLSGSATGVSYRLFKGSTAVGSAVAGTGNGISFAPVTAAGTYTVLATNTANTCTKAMAGSATVIVNELPAVFSVTGGGAYCAGGAGVEVALSGSESGVTYKLFEASSPMGTVTGTDNIVTFGVQTTAGTYTVLATNNATGCARNMNGSAIISITPTVVPVVTMTSNAGDVVCAGTLVTYTTAQANGGTTPAYQWTVNGDKVGTTSSYSYMPANGDVVSVVMTSNANCAASTATASKTMTVNAKETPVVTVSASATGTLCSGNPVTFTANALFGGDAPEFDWIKNGNAIATGATFTYAPANGDVLSVRLTSNFACVTVGMASSEAQTLTVIAPQAPTVVITANPGTTISQGQSLKLTAVASNTFQPAYQWYINGAAVHNATTTTFTSSDLNDKDTVTCRVANNTPCGEFASFNTVMISVETVGVGTLPTVFDVRVMPNPTKGNLVVAGTIEGAGNEDVTIEIANMLGQVVYKGQADVRNGKIESRIDLNSTLANGMYLLNLHTENGSKVLHITLQR